MDPFGPLSRRDRMEAADGLLTWVNSHPLEGALDHVVPLLCFLLLLRCLLASSTQHSVSLRLAGAVLQHLGGGAEEAGVPVSLAEGVRERGVQQHVLCVHQVPDLVRIPVGTPRKEDRLIIAHISGAAVNLRLEEGIVHVLLEAVVEAALPHHERLKATDTLLLLELQALRRGAQFLEQKQLHQPLRLLERRLVDLWVHALAVQHGNCNLHAPGGVLCKADLIGRTPSRHVHSVVLSSDATVAARRHPDV
mmetsp:Transcript_76726/g.225262  ORF Transcript_76726/g.225262 Transcript_76726/m.225262 type:complete len:250 (-) Transcript_76726:935-1684(-)